LISKLRDFVSARRIAAALLLSPESVPFFLFVAFAHVALKMLLGVVMVLDDGYGWGTLVAPPFSLVLAGRDIGFSYALALVLEWCIPQRRRRAVQLSLAAVMAFWLFVNFIVHSYCKSFVNTGLIQFNGAGFVELLDYARSAMSPPAWGFVAAIALGFALLWRTSRRAARRREARSERVAWAAAVAAIVGTAGAWIVDSEASAGMKGWLLINPFAEIASSAVRAGLSSGDVLVRGAGAEGIAEKLARFSPPRAPIFGAKDAPFEFEPPVLPKRPNVLFIVVESLPYEMTPLGGDATSPLTVLEKWRKTGINFDRFYTNFPATSRSFISAHCSLYPNADPATITKWRPDFDCDSMTAALHADGYRTGFFTASIFSYDNLSKSRFMESAYETRRDYFDLRQGARRNGVADQAVEEEAVVDALMRFIGEEKEKPFFATYFAFWSHAPYRLPFEDIGDMPLLERYRATLRYLNATFEDLERRLEAEGVLDDTIIVFTSDHGEGFATHHEGNLNHLVGFVYEENIRIPLLIRLPGMDRGVDDPRLGSNVDLAPTLFGLLGRKAPSSWQGRDLLSRRFESAPVLFMSRQKRQANGLVDGQYKYFFFNDKEEEHLFDLAADPFEQRDLAEAMPNEAAKYRESVLLWILKNQERYEAPDR